MEKVWILQQALNGMVGESPREISGRNNGYISEKLETSLKDVTIFGGKWSLEKNQIEFMEVS